MHVIDKGLPTTDLLAQVLVAKYLDHLPLYRQEAIFERAGQLIARSTLAQWVGVRISAIVDACFRLIVDGVSGHRGRAGVARKRGVQCISVVYDQFEARRGRAAVDAPVGRVLGLWI
jgi:hypothetical protein